MLEDKAPALGKQEIKAYQRIRLSIAIVQRLLPVFIGIIVLDVLFIAPPSSMFGFGIVGTISFIASMIMTVSPFFIVSSLVILWNVKYLTSQENAYRYQKIGARILFISIVELIVSGAIALLCWLAK